MDDFQSHFSQLLGVLREHERALPALDARINDLDDRLEHLRLEALAVSGATWAEMAAHSGEGRALAANLRKSAARIKETGLLLLEERLPDKAARLGEMSSFLNSLDSV